MATSPGRKEGTLIKLALLGDKHVGKTSLISRYVYDTFSLHYHHTVGYDQVKKHMTINNTRVVVKVVDAAGHNYIRSLIKSLYRDVHGILVVFDITRENTFSSVLEWLRQIEQVNSSNPVIFIVGNKLDAVANRRVPHEMAQIQCHRLEVPYIETSAKTGYNVLETFEALLRNVWHRVTPRIVSPKTIKISQYEETPEKSGCCSIT